MTHSLARLEISPAAYEEIKALFVKAGYDHVFLSDGMMNMNGIGIVPKSEPKEIEPANLELILHNHSGAPHWM